MIARDRAFAKFMREFEAQHVHVSAAMHVGMRAAFNEGWATRKQAELEAVLNIKSGKPSRPRR